MRYIYYISLFALLLSSCRELTEQSEDMKKTDPSQFEQTTELLSADGYPVVFYNVENLFDIKDDPHTSDNDFTPDGLMNWTEERYKMKLSNLSDVLSAINGNMPVMIGLSEVENKEVLIDLISEPKMKQSQYLIVHEESPDTRGIDVALIFDQNRFNYESHESLRINFPWDVNIKSRDILHVIGYFKNSKRVHVFVNHWSSRSNGVLETEPKRIEIAKVLRAKLDDIYASESDPNIIIMGDFNDTPDDKSVSTILRAKATKDLKEGELHNLSYKAFKAGKGSLVHEGNWEMLDQMICSKSMIEKGPVYFKNEAKPFMEDIVMYKSRDGKIPNKTYGGPKYYGGYSDHLPVYALLKSNE